MPNILYIATEDSEVAIREGELPSISDAELEEFRMSRAELHRCFAEGVVLMQGKKPADRLRPVATETLDGKWEVHLVRYSGVTDPLLQGRAKGTA